MCASLHAKPGCTHCADTLKCTLDAGLTMTEDGQCSDHVVVGTKAGDCLFLDAEHDGQVMLCFPAHRSAHTPLHNLPTLCTTLLS